MYEVLVPVPLHTSPRIPPEPVLARQTPSVSPTNCVEPSILVTGSSGSPGTIPASSLALPDQPPLSADPDAELHLAQLQDQASLDSAKRMKVKRETDIDIPMNFEVISKCMVGELRISILWDRSHRYFPGLRTVVQFKLIG
jgi:hypothetical protein